MFKLLYEEPEKLQKIGTNLFKVVLTILISQALFQQVPSEFKIDLTKGLLFQVELRELLLTLVVLAVVWSFVWEFLHTLWFAILFFPRSKKGAMDHLNRQDMVKILTRLKTLKRLPKGYLLPTHSFWFVYEVTQRVQKDDSSGFATALAPKVLYMATVLWFYLAFSFQLSKTEWIWAGLGMLVLTLFTFVLHMASKLFSTLKAKSMEVDQLISSMNLRRMVHTELTEHFQGKFDFDKEKFLLGFRGQELEVYDLYWINDVIGNSKLQSMSDSNISKPHCIVITNCEPTEKTKKKIRSSELKALIVAKNEEELRQGIFQLYSH